MDTPSPKSARLGRFASAFVVIVAAGLTTAVCAAGARPNVLFIVSDDLKADLSCYGNSQVKTPNIDRLAARGVRFDRAYCQYPLCNPSRASVMTGLRPDQTRVFDLTYHFRSGLPDVVTLPQAFMRAGYYAARVGKIYHYGNPGDIGTSGLDDAPSWQEFINPAGLDHTTLENDVLNFTPGRGRGSALALLEDPRGRDEDHTDGKVATEAIGLLEKHRNEPFFLAVGFYKPHCPWIAPKKYFDLYPLESIDVPELPKDYESKVPAAALMSTRPWPGFGVTRDQARQAKRGYYATVSFMDAQVGRVLDALDRLGLAENTIVVFWSDHGYHLGDHGLWFKQSCYEAANRVPVIIAEPGIKPAQITKRLVELVDLYPTLTDLAGVTAPGNLGGVSLRPLLANPSVPWNRPAYSQVERNGFPGYTVRTERWRYTEWENGRRGAELYEEERDPTEMNNLANDPRQAPTIAELQALIRQHWPVHVIGGKAAGKRKAE